MVNADIRETKVMMPPVPVRIRKVGIVDLDKLYKELADYLKEHKYYMYEKGISGKQQADGLTGKFEFVANKYVTEYFKFNLFVEFYVIRAKDVKIKGKKLKNIELEITFIGEYEKNYRKSFKSEWIRKIYETYIIRDKIDKMEEKLAIEFNGLINVAKEIMGQYKA